MGESEVEKYYSQKYEGEVFVDISMHLIGDILLFSKDFYLIENGKVFAIGGGKKYLTHDKCFDVHYQCYRLGKYSSKKEYNIKIFEIKVKDFIDQYLK